LGSVSSLVSEKKIFEISANQSILLALAAVIFQGGNYVLTIMDDYSGGWNVLLIAILECISIGWVYGKNQVVIIFQSAKQCERCIF
jgi:SNF family Na+-dependent transporter